MHRFFLSPDFFSGRKVSFPIETANQIRRVLRLESGTRVVALDNSGRSFTVRLSIVGKDVSGEIESELFEDHESPYRLTLLTPLTRREKFEWILQKCTEAGAARFIPTVSERSLVRLADEGPEKRERREKIIREAAEQSNRTRIPDLGESSGLADALTIPTEADALKIFFWERAEDATLKELLTAAEARPLPNQILLAVGPEGGYSDAEAAAARAAGWRIATLGKRILRMETAALAAVLLTNYGLNG